MSDWHSCIRCTWENDQCSKCGRPKGSPKNWRPSASSAITPAYAIVAPISVGASEDIDIAPAVTQQPIAAEIPTALTTEIPDPLEGVNLGEPVQSVLTPIAAETATPPSAPVSNPVIEAPAVAPAAVPFAARASSTVANGTAASAPTPAMLGHSPLGGSAAERYMKCSASVELANMLRSDRGDDDATQEEWTAEGTLAHSLLEHCLKRDVRDACLLIGGQGAWEAVDEKMAEAVQTALDYVRSRPGQMLVEHKFHRPELHELYYGQSDIVLYGIEDNFLEVIDYKNGAGVVVDVEHNEQLMYYANGVLHSPDFIDCPDGMPVRLTIMQPNAWHSDGKIRTWDTTAGYLRAWLHGDLLPRMRLTQSLDGWFFDMGEHCRFCPAKLGCPAFENLAQKALINARGITGTERDPKTPPGWKLTLTGEEAKLLTMLLTATKKAAQADLMAGAKPEDVGWGLYYGRSVRVWKVGAEEALKAALGAAAYVTELISPAVAEKLSPALVAQHAWQPDGAPTVGPIDPKKTQYKPLTAEARFSSHHVAKALATSVPT